MGALSVHAYQVSQGEPSAAAEFVCENRYIRVTLSSCEGGSVRAALREGQDGVFVRASALGKPGRAVLAAVREGEGEARALLGGTEGDRGVTWEAQVRLKGHSCAALLEWKQFNRRLTLGAVEPLRLQLPVRGQTFAGGAYCSLAGATLVIAVDRRVADLAIRENEVFLDARAPGLLPPLRTRVVSCTLHFVFSPGTPVAANELFVVLKDEDGGRLLIHASEETPSAKVFLQLESGETVEAMLSAYPERPAEYTLRGLGAPPKRILIRGEESETLMDATLGPVASVMNGVADVTAEPTVTLPVEWLEDWGSIPLARGIHLLAAGQQSEAERFLLVATHSPGLEHAAWFALGLSAMRSERWLLAAADFEESLLYCGSNPLAWWLKNWSLRRVGEEDEHDLPNAHYLAPLEPALRADAFLTGGGEQMLEDFAEDPVPFLEVADLLWWCGQEAERQMILAAGAKQTADGLLHRLRAAWLWRCGMEVEATEAERRAAEAKSSTEPRRVSEVLELMHADTS